MLSLLFKSFLDVLAPRQCLVCLAVLHDTEKRDLYSVSHYICSRCYDRLPPAPLPEELLASVRLHFPGDELAIGNIVSRFQREPPLTTDDAASSISPILYALKYHGMQDIGRILGRELGYCVQMSGAIKADVIVPIPIHSARKRERGYNQSERIAEGVADVLGIPVEVAWIRRKNYTLSQTYFSADERKENVRDVFRVEQKAVNMLKGTAILLVDDILTTGSTLNACAMTLLEGGARLVNAATVAKA